MRETPRRPPASFQPHTLYPFAAAAALGAVAAVHPAGILAAGGVLAALLILLLRRRLVPVFLTALGVLLAGYVFLNRGFAHIGVPPIYVGDVVLALGLVAIAAAPRSSRILALRHTVPWLALSFMAWGAVRTVPYLARDGVDALRDAVLWGYAVFALLVFAALDRRSAEQVPAIYRRLAPWFLLWLPIGAVATQLVITPPEPGGSVPLINIKLGDAGVHLAGIGGFLLLGLQGRWGALSAAIHTVAFLVAVGTVAILNRGGLLAASSAALALTAAKPSRTWLIGLLTAAALVGAVALVDPFARSEFPGGRSASLAQITQNVRSIFFQVGDPRLEGTEAFRLGWWSTIVDYTILGPYFWTGKGFGVNLGIDDGIALGADDSLRAPHNGHLTILARMGVPGLILWLALLLAFARSLLVALLRAATAGQEQRSRVLLWVLVYWLAMLVNMSFDPYLESPMGGIWFWSVLGFGLAVATDEDFFARPRGRGQEEVRP